jgi:hypothetical protein
MKNGLKNSAPETPDASATSEKRTDAGNTHQCLTNVSTGKPDGYGSTCSVCPRGLCAAPVAVDAANRPTRTTPPATLACLLLMRLSRALAAGCRSPSV